MSWDVEVKTAKKPEDWETCPAGNWPGTITTILDVGHHDAQDQESGKAYVSRKLVFGLEVAPAPAGPQKKDGSSFVFSKMMAFTMTTSSNLYDLVIRLMGRKPGEGESFNPTVLLGMPVMLEIVHTEGKTKSGERVIYANVKGIGSYNPNWPKPPTLRKPIIWGVFEGTPPPDLSFLPPIFGEKVLEIIRSCHELRGGAVPIPAPVPQTPAATSSVAPTWTPQGQPVYPAPTAPTGSAWPPQGQPASAPLVTPDSGDRVPF